jgi:hypothetical protein
MDTPCSCALAHEIIGASVFPATSSNVRLSPLAIYGTALPLRVRWRGAVRGGSGVQLAIALACSLALMLSVMPGKRRLSSMAADSSPSRS